VSWKALNRNEATVDPQSPALLSEALRNKIRSFFPRYETKRAAILPALHMVQDRFGHVSHQAMREVAEILDIHPSDVLDVVSFYTHFTTHPKGRKTLLVCRSLSCELLGGKQLLEALKKQLGVQEHGTTADGAYTLLTEECLAACDHAPCMMINERMHRRVEPSALPALLADPGNDKLPMPRSDLFDPPEEGDADGGGERTSDVREMKEA
jgi:NADH-quinone oxidoreductase subunit E